MGEAFCRWAVGPGEGKGDGMVGGVDSGDAALAIPFPGEDQQGACGIEPVQLPPLEGSLTAAQLSQLGEEVPEGGIFQSPGVGA